MTSTTACNLGTWLAEGQRLSLLQGLEERLRNAGYLRIAGVDEVGRGALAGPVAAGAVVVESGCTVPGVDDSKRLPPRRRERVARAIRRTHPEHSVTEVAAGDIDRLGIAPATRLAMERAVMALDPSPDLVLVDAVALPGIDLPVLPIIRGDTISYAVACASIIAKVSRDRTMTGLDTGDPAYAFARNKGYGSAAHRRALRAHGPCRHHRLSFRLGSGQPERVETETAG